jgi:molybdate transport system permease protein
MPFDPLVLTLVLAATTTAILLVIGTPIAFGLAGARGRWKPFVEALVALPLVLPPTVLGFYLLLAMGDHGLLGRAWQAAFRAPLAFSFPALVIGSVCYSLPFAVQPMQATFAKIDRELYEAAWTMGASKGQAFRWIALPLGAPGLLVAAVLSFAHTLGEFGVVLMVGGNVPGRTQTVSIAIYDLVEALRYAEAHALSLFLLVLSYAVLLGIYLANRRAIALGS